MNAIVLVGLGGALGAVARYCASLFIVRLPIGSFPGSTLVVNIVGSVLMGIFVGLIAGFTPSWQEQARQFVAVGLLGGFTTFSSFSLDTIILIERGELAQAMLYVVLSVVVCLAGLYLGLLITRGGAV